MHNNKKGQKKGFTLIEMLVSVAIFSIVLIVAMGAILTIIDANRKAQTLSSVMTNLNSALESMTRTIKTGVDPELSSGGVLEIDAIDLSADNFTRRRVAFKREENDGVGQIVRQIDGGDFVAITASEVNITKLSFDLFGESSNPADTAGPFNQPRTIITIEGVVMISAEIQSTFKVQTTVSQRRLNIAGEEAIGVD